MVLREILVGAAFQGGVAPAVTGEPADTDVVSEVIGDVGSTLNPIVEVDSVLAAALENVAVSKGMRGRNSRR